MIQCNENISKSNENGFIYKRIRVDERDKQIEENIGLPGNDFGHLFCDKFIDLKQEIGEQLLTTSSASRGCARARQL